MSPPGPGFIRRSMVGAPDKKPSFKRLVKHFGPFFVRCKGALAIGTVCVFIGLASSKVQPLITRFLVDDALTPLATQPWAEDVYRRALKLVAIAIAAMVALAVLAAVIVSIRTRIMRRAGAGLVRDIRLHVYDHLQKLSLRFYDSRQTGDIMSRVTGDVNALEQLVTGFGDRLLMAFLNLIVTVVILFVLSWKLAVVAVLPIPVLLLVMRWFSMRVRPIYRQVRDQMGSIHAKLQDNISGIRVIKAFNTEREESRQFGKENRDFFDTQMREVRLSSTALPAISFFEGMGAILVTAAGAYMLLQPAPSITLGDLFAFNVFVVQLYQPIGMLFQAYNFVLQAGASGERIAELLEEDPDIADAQGAVELKPVKGHVCFDNVSFHYQEDAPVLANVSIDAQPGDIVALVGHSGTGKTTIANLIPRFYDPVAGTITIDGVDLRSVTQESLRRQIAIVLQDPFLFNGTVLDNIRYAKPDATIEEVRRAASAAYADEFIDKLADGYETEIGERGVKLSGGQKQRLSIARALLADRRILILDEATSMIDSHAELLIQKALATLMAGRTAFVIAHRLSTIQHADQILVIEEGKIVERGRHDELLARDGLYARMCADQFALRGA